MKSHYVRHIVEVAAINELKRTRYFGEETNQPEKNRAINLVFPYFQITRVPDLKRPKNDTLTTM